MNEELKTELKKALELWRKLISSTLFDLIHLFLHSGVVYFLYNISLYKFFELGKIEFWDAYAFVVIVALLKKLNILN